MLDKLQNDIWEKLGLILHYSVDLIIDGHVIVDHRVDKPELQLHHVLDWISRKEAFNNVWFEASGGEGCFIEVEHNPNITNYFRWDLKKPLKDQDNFTIEFLASFV